MNRLKISTRLAISFSTMVLLLVAQGAMVLFLSAAQREAMEDIVQRSNPITKALSAVIDGSNMETIQFRNLALFSSPDIQQAALAQIKVERGNIAAQTQILDQLIESDEGKALHQSIKPLRAKDLALGNQFLELFAKEQWVEALALLESKQRPAQIKYQNAIRKQAELQAQVMAEAGHRAESATRNLTRGLLVASAVTIALALFLAITIIRSITRPLMQAVSVADRVASGDLSGHITVQSQDEMGHLLETLQRMQHSLAQTVTAVRSNAQGVASASAETSAVSAAASFDAAPGSSVVVVPRVVVGRRDGVSWLTVVAGSPREARNALAETLAALHHPTAVPEAPAGVAYSEGSLSVPDWQAAVGEN